MEQYLKYEDAYSINNYYGKRLNNNTYKTKDGTIPILLSAPHSVRQIRNNEMKAQDMYTGAIVDSLQNRTNCYSITNICTYNNDPNYDNIDTCKYKQSICKIIKEHSIKLVIDIHGLSIDKKSSIDICTNNNKTLSGREDILKYIKKTLEENISLDNKIVTINKYYNADLEFCVANYISRTYNIPSIELEINKSLRDPYNYEKNVMIMLNTLEHIISNINSTYII